MTTNQRQKDGYSVISVANQRPEVGLSRRSHGNKSLSTRRSQLDGDAHLLRRKPVASIHRLSQHDEPLNGEYSGSQALLNDQIHRQLWTPFWLRRTTLIAFAVLFIAFAIALIIVWHVAARNTGLSIRFTQNHYVWTYGPTAILVIVISLWRQLDYYCKALTPWQEMLTRPTKASRSMLLDYISPLQITTLTAAVRNRHPAVAASVLGFGLLKVIVVFSTGLLVSVPTSFIDTSSPLVLTTKFDATWNATLALGPYSISEAPDLIDVNSDASSDPLYAYYGVNEHGLSDPVGTKNGLAFQSFRLGNATRDQKTTQASALVEAFVPYPACELTEVSIKPEGLNEFDSSDQGGAVYLTVDSPTCHIGHDNFSTLVVDMKNPRTQPCEPRELNAQLTWVNCSLPVFPVYNASGPYQLLPYDDSNGDFRSLLTISDIRYTQTFGTSPPNNTLNITSWSRDVRSVTAILCKIRYTMLKMNLTYHFPEGESPSAVDIPSSTNVSVFDRLPGVSDSILTFAVFATLASSSTLLGSGNPANAFDTPSGADPLFQLMKVVSGPGDSFEPMLDGNTMSQAARKVFAGIASQFAQQNFILPTQQTTTGRVEYTENRLYVRPASLWFMVVGFIVMSCLAVTVLLTGPARVVPRDPASAGALATVLASSDHVQRLLKGTGHLPITRIQQKLSKYGFRTSSYDAFRISIVYQAFLKDDPRPHHPAKTRSLWKPLAIRKPVLGLTLTLPILAIGALEAMQQVSNRNQGLFTIETKTAEYAAYYLPTLIMLCIATLFNNLDFTVATFTPFSALRKGNVPAKKSVMLFLLGKTPLLSLFQALRNGHFGSALSNTAGLVGSLLTIIVSGLWILDPSVPMSHEVLANRVDTWHTSWNNSASNDSGAGSLLSLIQYQGLKDPPWTWDALAFPEIDLASTGGDSSTASLSNTSSASAEYTLTVPALRAFLNCTILTGEEIKIVNSFSPSAHPGTYITATGVNAQAELPPQCLASLPVGSSKHVNFSIDYYETWPGQPTNGSYIANFYDLHVPCTEEYCSAEPNSAEDIPDNPFGCPSIGFAFGYIRVNHTTLDNVTAAVCYQNLQEVETEVTYVGDLTLGLVSETRPPKPNESTIKLLTNGTVGFTAFPYRPEAKLATSLEQSTATSTNFDGEGYDAVFDFIVNGPGGTPADQLLGPANAATLVKTVNSLYGKYMAQAINLNFRRPITSPVDEKSSDDNSEPGETYPGTLLMPTPRLKVNTGSKLTLQILLAVMVVFGGLAFTMVEMRGTLPHNPHSIAGTMSLLAGSELCERSKIPAQSEWMSDRELDRLFGGQGWLYSLGWWAKAKEGGFSEEGEIEEEEEEEEKANEEEAEEEDEERFGIDVGRAEWR